MNRSAVRRVVLPMVVGTVLATCAGWWTFEALLAPTVQRTLRNRLRAEGHQGVEARVRFFTVSLRGILPTPAAREAVEATCNPTGGWGLRARAVDNRIKVPPSLTTVEVTSDGLRATGWVRDETEREALLDLALRQGGFERDQIDVSGVQVFPCVIPTGSRAISLSTPATARVVSGLDWLHPLWDAMPKMPRLEGNPEGRALRLRGRVATEVERESTIRWVASIRPDLKVDGSRIELDPRTRPLQLPAAGSPPPPDSWLQPLANGLAARPSLRFRAAHQNAPASLSGLVPAAGDWVNTLNPQGKWGSHLKVSPVIRPNPEEDLAPATLASLIHAVSGLREGLLEYEPGGLLIQGEGDPGQIKALRAIDLEPFLPDLTRIEVRSSGSNPVPPTP